MSESQSERYTVVNMRDQPIELYLSAEQITLSPYGEIEIDSGDLTAPQLESMLRRQLIDVRPVAAPAITETAAQDEAVVESAEEEAAPDAAAAETRAVQDAPARRTRRKS